MPDDKELRRSGMENQGPEFDHPAAVIMSNCPKCNARIGIHCDECKIRITGCNCTFAELIDIERQRMRAARLGLVGPNGLPFTTTNTCPGGGTHRLRTDQGKTICVKCEATIA